MSAVGANINLLTPTHYLPQIAEALALAAAEGLKLPLVYNSSGYERIASLRLLDRIVGIYLPDLKYAREVTAREYSGISGYPRAARDAAREMHRQVGDLVLDGEALAVRGLLIRHLVMPGGIGGTAELMEFIARRISPRAWIKIMDQYHPAYRAGEHPEIDRRITGREYREALTAARKSGPGFHLL